MKLSITAVNLSHASLDRPSTPRKRLAQLSKRFWALRLTYWRGSSKAKVGNVHRTWDLCNSQHASDGYVFGAALASVVGPAVEPHMCEDQAAKAGGGCGPNIRRACQHLRAQMHTPRSTGTLWYDILGDCQNSLDPFIEQHFQEYGERTDTDTTTGAHSKEAAVLLAGQKQAFEGPSIRWFEKILDGWQFPQWVRRSFTALVENRSVTAAGQIGALRRLLRSVGMGGTASPLSWGMAYDPIVEGMFRAIGVGTRLRRLLSRAHQRSRPGYASMLLPDLGKLGCWT